MKERNSILVMVCGLLAVLSGIACINRTAFNGPPGYDLNKPVKYNMPDRLTEISGIAFQNGKADMIYAEEDEKGRVYYFKLGDKNIPHAEFGKPGDYEDIAILNGQVVMLRSDGSFYVFALNEVRNGQIKAQKMHKILPSGEYEGLYGDDRTHSLYALCKHCDADNTAKTCSGYIFSLSADGEVKQSGQFSIDVKNIAQMAGQQKMSFHPSALARNPGTGEWYILSSVNKLLVVADAQWKVKAVYALNPGLFPQPEGMAFDTQNNLYISNEGDKYTSGNILKFNYKK